MIILKTLEWSNCFSYGENNSIDLTAETVTQILGLNGAGKSSIPVILEEVLYNKNSKGIKKANIANRYTNKGYSISLDLDIDDIPYRIEVIRGATVKVKLLKAGQDISSHTATETFKQIESLLGDDFKTFSQKIYQSPINSLQFLTATDSKRKEFLINILDLEKYISISDDIKEVAKNINLQVSNLEGKLSNIESWLHSNSNIDLNTKELLPEPEDFDLNKILEEKNAISGTITNSEKINKQIINNEQYKKLLSNIDIEYYNSLEVEEPEDPKTHQSKIGSLEQTVKAEKAFLSKITKLGDKCPTCEQDIQADFKSTLINTSTSLIEQCNTELDELEKTISELKKKNALYKEKHSKIKDWESLYNSIDKDLPEITYNVQDLKTSIADLDKQYNALKAELNTIKADNVKIIQHNSKVATIIEQMDSFLNSKTEVKAELSSVSALNNKLTILKKAFSSTGLIAYKIENLVKDLENITNSYLAELSDGRFTIQFVLVSDKLNVSVTDNGLVVDISELSSGELARVNTSTLLAIRKLMGSMSTNRVNVLFLDEVINVLDDIGRERLVEILNEEELNTYIVSHGYSHPLLSRIEVVKENNISRIIHG